MDKNEKWTEVGLCAVDSGMIWVGDPCYFLPRKAPPGTDQTQTYFEAAIGDYDDMIEPLQRDDIDMTWARVRQYDFKGGNCGLGVGVDTAHGDGSYPVFVRYDAEGRVVALRIDFADGAEVTAESEEE